MYIVRKSKLVFLPLPKNGSRTLGVFIEHQLGGSTERTEHHAVRPVDDTIRDFTAFAIVRNPFSRMVSKWWEKYSNFDDGTKKTRQLTFNDYINNLKVGEPGCSDNTLYLSTQCSVIDAAQKYYNKPIKILRLESLADDWISTGLADLTKKNFPAKTKKFGNGSAEYGDWTKYYNKSLEEKVASVYYADIDRFGYSDRVK